MLLASLSLESAGMVGKETGLLNASLGGLRAYFGFDQRGRGQGVIFSTPRNPLTWLMLSINEADQRAENSNPLKGRIGSGLAQNLAQTLHCAALALLWEALKQRVIKILSTLFSAMRTEPRVGVTLSTARKFCASFRNHLSAR